MWLDKEMDSPLMLALKIGMKLLSFCTTETT